MKKWFRYIFLTTILMIIGYSGVDAKECKYNDGKNAVTITTNATAQGYANAKITKFDGKNKNNGESLLNADGYSWSESNCPQYVLVKYTSGINGASVWGVDTKDMAQTIASSKKLNSKNYAILSTSDASNVSTAASGVEGADLTCAYKTNNGTITCSISVGDSFSKCAVNVNRTTLGENAKLPIGNFEVDTDNDGIRDTLTCPKNIYYEASGGVNGNVYNNFSGANTKTENNIEATLSEKTADVKVNQSIIECPYGDLTLRIDTSAKTIKGINKNCSGGEATLNFNYNDYVAAKKNNKSCFEGVYKKRPSSNTDKSCTYSLKDESTNTEKYDVIEYDRYNNLTDANGDKIDNDSSSSNGKDNNYGTFSCDNSSETIKLLKQVYTMLRYLIPVLIIGLSIVDFVKVVANGEDKAFKEAWNKFIKRIIVGIIILILPALLAFIIKLSGVAGMYGIDENNIFCIFD